MIQPINFPALQAIGMGPAMQARLACGVADPLAQPMGEPAGLTLVIHDSGEGIPTTLLPRIFEDGYTTRTGTARPTTKGRESWPSVLRARFSAMSQIRA